MQITPLGDSALLIRVAENFEKQELIMEGVLAIVDNVHPSLIQMRLNCFLRNAA